MKNSHPLKPSFFLRLFTILSFSLIFVLTPSTCFAKNKKILLVGNSYIFFNDLPQMLNELIKSSGEQADIVMAAKPGWKLQQHAGKTSSTMDQIKRQNWDYVVLQEQSVIPALMVDRQKRMIPAVKVLDKVIKAQRAKTVLLMTWGRRDGLQRSRYKTFDQMQRALYKGYMQAAKSVKAIVAPAGMAWAEVINSEAYLPLYQDDGSHPNLAGSYLTACVLYCVIYKKSPEGLRYTANLGQSKAEYLQKVAAKIVLKNKSKWNIR